MIKNKVAARKLYRVAARESCLTGMKGRSGAVRKSQLRSHTCSFSKKEKRGGHKAKTYAFFQLKVILKSNCKTQMATTLDVSLRYAPIKKRISDMCAKCFIFEVTPA